MSKNDKVMLSYDVDLPEPFGLLRSAVLLTINKDNLITKVEIFYDATAFRTNAQEIFSK